MIIHCQMKDNHLLSNEKQNFIQQFGQLSIKQNCLVQDLIEELTEDRNKNNNDTWSDLNNNNT